MYESSKVRYTCGCMELGKPISFLSTLAWKDFNLLFWAAPIILCPHPCRVPSGQTLPFVDFKKWPHALMLHSFPLGTAAWEFCMPSLKLFLATLTYIWVAHPKWRQLAPTIHGLCPLGLWGCSKVSSCNCEVCLWPFLPLSCQIWRIQATCCIWISALTLSAQNFSLNLPFYTFTGSLLKE